jgi:hypothetical protein
MLSWVQALRRDACPVHSRLKVKKGHSPFLIKKRDDIIDGWA